MYCRSCSSSYSIEQFAGAIDDDMEERLANIPCNRL
ncbi:MAG: dual CXXC motif small (seleno)protein [Desulfococcaceae bacterium]